MQELSGSPEHQSAADEEVVARPRPPKEDIVRDDPHLIDNHGASTSNPANSNDVPVPAAIGRETCPICIVDFEDDDDVRILPCEGKHRFHQQCVDPWLLELSSSCPICRQGAWTGRSSG